jgi:hypothetical protein
MIEYLKTLTTSPFFIGMMLLLLNVGSRFITHEFSADDKEYSENILLRRLAIFAVCFVGTRELVVSILLTAAFVVMAGGIFRGKGPFSREGMNNQKHTADQPAYDKDVPLLFK